MKITVKLIGPFVNQLGFSEKEFTLARPTTVEDVLALAGIEKSRPKIVTRNGRAVAPGESVEDGDRVVISPIYSGG
jgi:sulfur carrier protein ThiS